MLNSKQPGLIKQSSANSLTRNEIQFKARPSPIDFRSFFQEPLREHNDHSHDRQTICTQRNRRNLVTLADANYHSATKILPNLAQYQNAAKRGGKQRNRGSHLALDCVTISDGLEDYYTNN